MDLVELKKKYRTIYFLEIDGLQIIFRLPSWREHEIYRKTMMISNQSHLVLEDRIFKDICLDPLLLDQMNNLPAGIISTVVEVALNLSGEDLGQEGSLDRLNADLQKVRTLYESNLFEQLIVLICQAFPSMTPPQVEDLPYPELIRLTVMAEKILYLKKPLTAEYVKEEKKKSAADLVMGDSKKARAAEMRSTDDEDNIEGTLQSGQPTSPEQARQMAMLRRIQERRMNR